MKPITESHIETFTIETHQSLGWEYIHGLAIAPGAETQGRENFEIILLMEFHWFCSNKKCDRRTCNNPLVFQMFRTLCTS